MRRRESAHANDRKHVRLAHLKLVDLIRTNDTIRFTYKERVFDGHVTIDSLLALPRHALHTLADRSDDAHSYYRLPSNLTNDCLRVYYHGEPSSTNPSGYERIRHVPSGKTLNELRDAYMATYDDDDDDLSPPPPSKRRATAAPTTTPLGDECARVLADGAVTIATLQAEGRVRGYKDIATALQRKLAEHRKLLLAVLAHTGNGTLATKLDATSHVALPMDAAPTSTTTTPTVLVSPHGYIAALLERSLEAAATDNDAR